MRHSSFIAASLCAGVSIVALIGATEVQAASDIGSVNIDTAREAKPQRAVRAARPAPARAARPALVAPTVAPVVAGPPIASDAAIGRNAPTGSAPALAPAQQSLNATEPGSVISQKIIQDVVIPTGDYNETAKFTPNFTSTNPNGAFGDSKSQWRGFQDGQFNITFDGIPFGDANDPTHHSAAYFPAAFLGQVVIDRGPGPASQVGYATFGGTMGLQSYALSDTFGGSMGASFGGFNTSNEFVTLQSGYNKEYQTRALLQFEHSFTDGQYDYGHYNQINVLAKVEKQFGDVTATFFGAYGTENYLNVATATWPQLQLYGKNYGEINANPKSQQYFGYNNSAKRTDMEYIDLKSEFYGFKIDNKDYTYAYDYPNYQNNGADQTIEGNASIANNGTITSVKVPLAAGGSFTTKFGGVANGDVTGYIKYNNYRSYGDILNIKRDLGQDWYRGELRFGTWFEHTENSRLQEYIDYTTGVLYPALPQTTSPYNNNANYKLLLNSNFNNVQPFVEYEWKPTDQLSITPGYKYESFSRIHDAAVNQTTLQTMSYSTTYQANLPFLTARYKVNDQWTVYGQASQGFLVPTVSAYYVFNPGQSNIQPQGTTNYQIGAVYKTRDLTADVAIYQQRATNFPVTDTFKSGPNVGQTFYYNGGTAQYRGAEFQGTWAFGRQIGWEGWALSSAVGISNAVYTQGANAHLAVGDAPDYTIAGGVLYDDKTFFGSVLQKFVGPYYGANGQKNWVTYSPAGLPTYTNAGLNRVPGYNSTDVVAGYRYKLPDGFAYGYGKQIEFKIGVQNLLDHRSITEISGNPTGLTSINNTVLGYQFQSGRYIYGAVKYDF